MLSLTVGWVQHPIQIRNKDHTTNFCWANSSSNGKCPVGESEGEGALVGCRYVKSKHEILKNTLAFSYKITKNNALKSIIVLTSQSTCRTESVWLHIQWSWGAWGAEDKTCLSTAVLLEPLHAPHHHRHNQGLLGSLYSSLQGHRLRMHMWTLTWHRIKPIPGVTAYKMPLWNPWKIANISLRHCKWQDDPLSHPNHNNHASILLGMVQSSLSFYKVYSFYCFSSGGRTTKKSHLKMLRDALTQPCLAPRPCWHTPGSGGRAVGTCSSPAQLRQRRRAAGCVRQGGQAGRRLPSELALAAGMGRD